MLALPDASCASTEPCSPALASAVAVAAALDVSEAAASAAVGDVPWAIVGEVVAEPVVELFGTAGKSERIAVGELAAAWRSLARENT